MRGNRGRGVELDDDLEPTVRHVRRGSEHGPQMTEARDAWEPIVCPECGFEHEQLATVRLKRAGQEIEARCSHCGVVAARYVSGVWSS